MESVDPDNDIEEAADLMASCQVRRLPVVQGGRLIGMVSLGDIAVKHEESTASQALEGVSEGVKASPGASAWIEAQPTQIRPKAVKNRSHKSTSTSTTATRKRAA